jgi:hypothetical protein
MNARSETPTTVLRFGGRAVHATAVVYPFWAFWVGRHLLRRAGEPDSAIWAGIGPRSGDKGGMPSK